MSAMKKRVLAVASVASVLVLLGVGVAYALYTVTGVGHAKATSAAAKNLVISDVEIQTLVPGKTSSGTMKVRNDNNFDVTLQKIDLVPGTFSVKPAACDQYLDYPNPAGKISPTAIPAGKTVTVTVDKVIVFKSGAPESCSDAVVEFDFKVTGVQVEEGKA